MDNWLENLKEGDSVFIVNNQQHLKVATILRFTAKKIVLNETSIRYDRTTGKTDTKKNSSNLIMEYNEENRFRMVEEQFRLNAINKLNSIRWRNLTTDELEAIISTLESF